MSDRVGGTPRPLCVAIVTQFFAPEPCAASNRLGSLARQLVEHGADVTVITGMPSFPSGVIAPAYRGAWFRRERLDGMSIERVWTFTSSRIMSGTRVLNWASVAAGTTLRLLLRRTPLDVLIVSSPPITLVVPALIGAFRHRAALVADIRDVFPEVAITMGMWRRESAIARAVRFAADAFYRTARTVVCVTESAREEIRARHVDDGKLVVAPNGFDRVSPEGKALARRDDEFVLAYVGNMGLATGLDVVLDAARSLQADRRFRFVLVGGGADARRLEDRTRVEGLRNVEFLGVRARADAMRILIDADACVIPLKKEIHDSLPTKMFDAMALGRPIVLSASGEARTLLQRANAGIAADPENGEALAAAIRELAADPQAASRYGESGRSYVYEHYDRDRIMRNLAARIVSAGASRVSMLVPLKEPV